MTIGDSFFVDSQFVHSIGRTQFQGSHLIYEHEYQCTVQEHEFNTSLNSSALDQKDSNPFKISSWEIY